MVSPTLMLATATTDAPSSVTSTGATFNGSYNANGQSAYAFLRVGHHHVLRERHDPAGPGTGTGSVSAGISGLTANTIYHYRLVIEDVDGFRSYGSDRVFSTETGAPNAPTVSGGAANWQNIASQTIWATGGDDYAGTGASTGQLGRYEFDAGSGTTVADRSGNGNTMSWRPPTHGPPTGFGNPNAAIAFDGSGGYATCPASPPAGRCRSRCGRSFDTLGTWVRLFDFGETNAQGPLNNFTLSNGGAASDDLRLVSRTGDAGGHYYDVYANNAIRVGEWQHYAATIDASGNMKLYVDGALVASAAATPPADRRTAPTTTSASRTSPPTTSWTARSTASSSQQRPLTVRHRDDRRRVGREAVRVPDLDRRRVHLELGDDGLLAHRHRRGRDAGAVPGGRQQRPHLRLDAHQRHDRLERAHRPHRPRHAGGGRGSTAWSNANSPPSRRSRAPTPVPPALRATYYQGSRT